MKNRYIRAFFSRFPVLKRLLRPAYYFLRGEFGIRYSHITKEILYECAGKPDPTILEIGCNDGSHTLWFLEIFENPEIYCFEPDPRAVARFKRKVGIKPNIHLYEIALSDMDGETVFHQSDQQKNGVNSEPMSGHFDLSGSIRKPKNHLQYYPEVAFNQKIFVRTKTLDTWCREQAIGTIDLIWMDVQGAEMDVIIGGQAALSRTRYLYTEYSNFELYEGQATFKQLLNKLRDFEVVIRYPVDVLLKNRMMSSMPN